LKRMAFGDSMGPVFGSRIASWSMAVQLCRFFARPIVKQNYKLFDLPFILKQ